MSEDPLTEIHGIGESKAEEIRAVVGDTTDAKEQLAEAIDYMDAGNYEYAEKFVRRAHTEL